jgi:hypothetical protein
MRFDLCNKIVYKLDLVLGVLYTERTSHSCIFSDEFSVTDELTEHLTERVLGSFNERHPVV